MRMHHGDNHLYDSICTFIHASFHFLKIILLLILIRLDDVKVSRLSFCCTAGVTFLNDLKNTTKSKSYLNLRYSQSVLKMDPVCKFKTGICF